MCGIYGSLAKKGQKVDLHKMEVLALWNERRGPDSCGYYYAGNIQKGVDFYKLAGDFFIKNPYKKGVLDCEVFMGHTRKSTSGVNSEANAHPHQVDNYVQTHNGVIKNIWTLCNKYDIDAKDISVDSIGLANIIKATGWDVLNHYKGYAALVMTFTDKPNVVYLYHGASKEKDTDEKPSEERPLFILETPEALYYSSIYNSLVHINSGDNKPVILPHNKVFKVEDGVINLEEVQYTVKREHVNADSDYQLKMFFDKYDFDPKTQLWIPALTKELPPPKTTQISPVVDINFNCNTASSADITCGKIIMREEYPEERYTRDVYYRFGRYMRGHNILLHGIYEIDRDGTILKFNGEVINKKNDRTSEIFYFVRGVMLRNKTAFEEFRKIYLTLDCTKAFAFVVSEYSKYPVINLSTEGLTLTDTYKYYWWHNKKKFNGDLQVKFASRTYTIKTGLFRYITGSIKGEKLILANSHTIPDLILDDDGISGDVLKKSSNQTIDDDKDAITLNNIVDMVYQWCFRALKKDDVKIMPEQFLMFVDWLTQEIYANESPFQGIDISIAEIERQTMEQLKNCIFLNKSIASSMVKSKYVGLISPSHIRKCFADWYIDDIVQAENRYLFTPFEFEDEYECRTTPSKVELDIQDALVLEEFKNQMVTTDAAEEFEDKYEELVDQLVSLEKIADNLQVIEGSTKAQDACHSVYVAISIIKEKLKQVVKDDRPAMASILQKIKSC